MTYRDKAFRIHAMAADNSRKVRIAAMCYVVRDESDAKAQETVGWMTDQIDRTAIETWLVRSGHILRSDDPTVDASVYSEGRSASGATADPYLGIGKTHYESLGMGIGAIQLFGSYESVADQLIDRYEAGVGQFALYFFDPHKGVRQVEEHLLPILRGHGFNLPLA